MVGEGGDVMVGGGGWGEGDDVGEPKCKDGVGWERGLPLPFPL